MRTSQVLKLSHSSHLFQSTTDIIMPYTTESSKALKEQFIAELGQDSWSDGWEAALGLSPEIVSASLKLSSVPKHKKHLAPKIQCLIAIAVDSASTHLYVPGIQRHVRAALKQGATPAEVMEVLELTSTLGIHACNIGVPLLTEVMREEGLLDSSSAITEPFDQRREHLKKEFTEKRGYWHEFWEDFLRLDPEFFEAYLEFSSVPWTKGTSVDGIAGGVLEPKVSVLTSQYVAELIHGH